MAVYKRDRRIIAIGDIHAARDVLTDIMQRLSLVDDSFKWIAENTILVMMGDMCDRGYDSRTVYELLIKWQDEAKALDSVLYFLIGNHEVLNVFRQLHYATTEETLGYARKDDYNGFRSRLQAFSPGGWIYKWLMKQTVIMQIGEFVFAHADFPVSFKENTYEQINTTVFQNMQEGALNYYLENNTLPEALFSEINSMLWCRQGQLLPIVGYTEQIEYFLKKQNASVYVCGHTPATDGRFKVLHNKRYLCIDTAMVFQGRGMGKSSALMIEGKQATAYYFYSSRIEKKEVQLKLD